MVSLLLLARAERTAGNQMAACEAWRAALQSAEKNSLNPPEIAQEAIDRALFLNKIAANYGKTPSEEIAGACL